MLDAFLAKLSTLDWITPVAAFLADLTNGPSHTFFVPHDCGQSGHEITRMLSGYGIHCWGGMIVNKTIMFTVRQGQARWAQYQLLRHEIPIASGLLDGAGRPAERAAQSPAHRRGPLRAFLADWLG